MSDLRKRASRAASQPFTLCGNIWAFVEVRHSDSDAPESCGCSEDGSRCGLCRQARTCLAGVSARACAGRPAARPPPALPVPDEPGHGARPPCGRAAPALGVRGTPERENDGTSRAPLQGVPQTAAAACGAGFRGLPREGCSLPVLNVWFGQF